MSYRGHTRKLSPVKTSINYKHIKYKHDYKLYNVSILNKTCSMILSRSKFFFKEESYTQNFHIQHLVFFKPSLSSPHRYICLLIINKSKMFKYQKKMKYFVSTARRTIKLIAVHAKPNKVYMEVNLNLVQSLTPQENEGWFKKANNALKKEWVWCTLLIKAIGRRKLEALKIPLTWR